LPERPAIPAAITREILIESGHRCAVCGATFPLERAHIVPWHKSREHNAEDLICLCASCHERADLEGWGEKTLREYKQKPWILRQYKSEEAVSRKSKIEITLAVELSDFDERDQRLFQYAIAAFLNVTPDDVRIISVEESNSIKVILEVPSENAEKLVEAARGDDSELKAYLYPFGLLSVGKVTAIPEGRLDKAESVKDIEPPGRPDTRPGSDLAESEQKSNLTGRSTKAIVTYPPRTKSGSTVNPFRALAEQFVRRSPATLLTFGIALSLVDFVALYAAAANEGVLYVSQGVGLLNHYGLLSTIFGNAVFLYAAKKYYDCISSTRTSNAIVNPVPIEEALSTLTDMIKMRGKYRSLIYFLVIIGATFWLSNAASYGIGNPEIRWGQKVFDSADHPWSFIASRLHNLYTWLIIMPFVGHVLIYSSLQLKRAIATAALEGALKYDLLNPDQRGGFIFVDRAHFAFNSIIALIFIQVTIYNSFTIMNAERVIFYAIFIMTLIGMHRMVLGDIYATVRRLRFESLNKVKANVYKDDKLSFEILKYCYERRTRTSSIVAFVISAAPIVISVLLKLWPAIAKVFTRD
jgi:hypothetical protein